MIQITKTFALPDHEVEEKFVHASGPGGQNVNKVATAVQLRFDIDQSTSLPEAIKQRLKQVAQNQMTKDNILIIEAKHHRTQQRNRRAARAKLAQIIRKAMKPAQTRRKTKPPAGAKEKRLENKRIRSEKKRLRKPPSFPQGK